jgi:hypothetical protein
MCAAGLASSVLLIQNITVRSAVYDTKVLNVAKDEVRDKGLFLLAMSLLGNSVLYLDISWKAPAVAPSKQRQKYNGKIYVDARGSHSN